MKPDLEIPGLNCDCTGFCAWANRVSRYVEKWNPMYELGDWFESTVIVRDAKSPFGFVDLVPMKLARPGMLFVWGDVKGRSGHAGIITEVAAAGPVRVIHCSRGNEKAYGDAVYETDAGIFYRNGAIVARLGFVDYV